MAETKVTSQDIQDTGIKAVDCDTNEIEIVARKAAVNGYAPLDAGALVPTNNLGTGVPSVSTFLRGDKTWSTLAVDNSQLNSPLDPVGTISTVGVMMGLGVSVTPSQATQILVVMTGIISVPTGGNGANYQVRFGTGVAPINGAALTGTAVGKLKHYVNDNATGIGVTFTPGKKPFALSVLITGLTSGTTYWIDISLAHVGTGLVAVSDIDVVSSEF